MCATDDSVIDMRDLEHRHNMFTDREDAGDELAKALEKYRGKKVLVLGIPRGGVVIAYRVAKRLNARFDIIVSRKLPYPQNPEAGFGAVAEDGSTFMFPHVTQELSGEAISRILEEQGREAARRVEVLRGGRPLPEMEGKTVILVDDGIAMGSTMRVSVMLCRKRGAGKIIVAVPVAGERVAREIESEVDELIVLEKPEFFQAVAQVYENWYDVPDDEVIEIMEKASR